MTTGWFLRSCHWSTNHVLYKPNSLTLRRAVSVAFANSPLVHSSFAGVPRLEFTPDLSKEKIRFVFRFKNARGKDALKQWVYLLFRRGFTAEVVPAAISRANRQRARCQHQLNHKLQGEIGGGTGASCPWPIRIPCHQALCFTGRA